VVVNNVAEMALRIAYNILMASRKVFIVDNVLM